MESAISRLPSGTAADLTSGSRQLEHWGRDNSSYSLVCEEKYRSDMLWQFFDVGGFMGAL